MHILTRPWEDLTAALEHRRVHPHPNPPPAPVAPACPVVTVRVINHSTVVADEIVAKAVTDLQTQVSHDWAPIWLFEAELMVGTPGHSGPGEYLLFIEDDATVQGALGFHEVVRGVPTGHVFARTCQQYGAPWTATASHELLEMLGDPRTNMVVSVDVDAAGTLATEYMAEVCDAVEQSTYMVGQTAVSNFVTPAWFSPDASGPYDHLGLLKAPLALLPWGSYIGVRQVQSEAGWTQQTAEKAPSPGGPISPGQSLIVGESGPEEVRTA